MKLGKNSSQEARKLATKIAELKETDKQDFDMCVEDMQKLAGLDKQSSKLVAHALRDKILPEYLKDNGIEDEKSIQELTRNRALDEGNEDEEITEDEPLEDNDVELEEEEEESAPNIEQYKETVEVEDDPSIADDQEMARIQIDIPVDKINEVQLALENIFGKGNLDTLDESAEEDFDDEEINEDEEVETDDDDDDIEFEEHETNEIDDDDEVCDETEDEDVEKDIHSDKMAGRKINMDKSVLAARKAARKKILAQVSEDKIAEKPRETVKPTDIGLGKDTSFNGKPYQFSDKNQYTGTMKDEALTLENSSGNSLKEQNPTMVKHDIPTLNTGDRLQLSDSYDVTSKEGTPDGTLQYKVDFEAMNKVPSAGGVDFAELTVPTQMDYTKVRKTTVAKRQECDGCNNPNNLRTSAVECNTCKANLVICEKCEDDEYCPSCKANEAKMEKDSAPEITIDLEAKKKSKQFPDNGDGFARKPLDNSDRKASELYRAKLKTAYRVSTKLVLAGILDIDEVDENVDLWLNDNLSVESMLNTGKLMLKSAQNASERVANTVDKMSRTASLSGLPILVSDNTKNNSITDIRSALKGIWSSPVSDEDEN